MRNEIEILAKSYEFTLLMQWNKKTHFVLTSEILQKKIQREIGDFFAVRPNGLITFCPAGRKQEYNEDGKWKRAGRNEMKAAKFLKKIFAFASGQELEMFATKAKSLFCKFDIEILPAGYINKIYANEDFDTCMTGDNVGDFYSAVGAQIMILKKEGTICGRAIVWPEVYTSDGEEIKVIDRIYATEKNKNLLSEMVETVRQYAEQNGYHTKQKMSYDSKVLFVDSKGEYVTLQNVTVKIGDITSIEYFPYVDTFTYTDGDSYLNNYAGTFALDSTDGTCEGISNGYVRCADGSMIAENEACMVGDDWYHIDDCVICHRSQEWILLSDSYRIELSGCEAIYIHSEYVTQN